MNNQIFQSNFNSVLDNIEEKLKFQKGGKRKANNSIPDAYKNLIVNYLPTEVDEECLMTMFGLIGEVDKVHIMRDMSNKQNGPGKSFGYGFVDYISASDGEKAVELLNGTKILNKTIKVSFSRPTANDSKLANIYVSGLPKTFSQQDLDDLYSKYGTIVSSKIIQNSDKSIGRNIAFVRFDKREQANEAINGTNNSIPPGCSNSIQVRFSNTPNSKNVDIMKRRKVGDFQDYSDQEDEIQIYVYNLNPETDDNALWKLFGAFGAIKNAKAIIDTNTNKCRGFGFVTMKYLNEAVQAIQTLNGYTHDNRVLQVSFKNNKNGELETKGVNLNEVTGTYTLYIYNINPDTEDITVWKLFGQFGAVKNVKIIRDAETTKSKGFAFVTMKNMDEAAEAVRILNGFTLDNRVLQVSFKTKKNSESFNENEFINNDIPSHVATDRFGSVQIFVYNLSEETEEKHLWKLFGQFGAVKNVKVLGDKSSKYEYKGHAFVSMKDYKDATIAVGSLNGILLDGRSLQVSFKLKSNNNNN